MASMSYLGIGSGMDMGTILEKLLQQRAAPITNYQNQKTRVEQAHTAWTNIGTSLSGLGTIMDTLRDPATFRPSTTSATDDKVATATVSGQLNAGQSFAVKVNQLASAQSMYSRQFSGNATMGTAGTLEFKTANGEQSFSVNYSADTTISQLAKLINDAAKPAEGAEEDAKAFVSASIIDGRLVLTSSEAGAANGFTVNDTNGNSPLGNFQMASGLSYLESQSFTYSDVAGMFGSQMSLTTSTGQTLDIAIGATDTLEKLVEKINSQFTEATGNTKQAVYLGGGEGAYTLRFDSSVVAQVSGGGMGLDGNTNVQYSGQDALLNINGLNVRSSSNEVSLVEGLSISLKETGSTTLTVQSAADDVASTMKSFIDQYNTLYSSLKSRMENTLASAPYASDEERETAMLNRDPLASDRELRQLASDLQDLFSYTGNGDIKSLSSIGIEMERDGSISFDEAKFKKAFDANPEAVNTFFRGVASEDDPLERTGGFANAANKTLKYYTDATYGIVTGQKEYYNTLKENYTSQITRMQESLSKYEETLTRKFSAADVAIASAESKWQQASAILSSASSSSSSNILAQYGL